MSGKKFNTPEVVAKAIEVLNSSTDVPNLKERAQSIYWNAEKGMELEEIAKLLDVSSRTVKRWRKDFYYYATQNIAIWENWGGRRTMNLSLEEEKDILQKCEERAHNAEIVTRKIIQEEYENRLGRKVV